MGNYHQYETKCYTGCIKIPEGVAFFDENAVYCLVNHGYVERKRWDFVKDMKNLSSTNMYTLIIVIETDEDETINKQHQFYNGDHRSVDGVVVYPEIIW